MRVFFDRDLQKMQDQLLLLGSEVAEHLVGVTEALTQRDQASARRFMKADMSVNERRIKIEMECLTLIATQQPAGSDMRRIAAIIEIAGELERIHDYVKGIGKISQLIDDHHLPEHLARLLSRMARKAAAMLRQSLEAFGLRDLKLAQDIPLEDDEVDALYYQFYRETIHILTAEPTLVERVNFLQWAAHNLERSADRVTNICEWVVYMITGRYEEMDTEVEAPPA
jgi:phosphate transport system protein